jgi:hypothetical protein
VRNGMSQRRLILVIRILTRATPSTARSLHPNQRP